MKCFRGELLDNELLWPHFRPAVAGEGEGERKWGVSLQSDVRRLETEENYQVVRGLKRAEKNDTIGFHCCVNGAGQPLAAGVGYPLLADLRLSKSV